MKRLPAPCRHPAPWILAFASWAVALWFLSDGPVPVRADVGLPFFDKLLHFGYFFGGAGLLAGVLFLTPRSAPSWPLLILSVTVIVAGIGILDEWHQSRVPARSGNDGADWLADAFGALAGALVFKRFAFLVAPDPPQPDRASPPAPVRRPTRPHHS